MRAASCFRTGRPRAQKSSTPTPSCPAGAFWRGARNRGARRRPITARWASTRARRQSPCSSPSCTTCPRLRLEPALLLPLYSVLRAIHDRCGPRWVAPCCSPRDWTGTPSGSGSGQGLPGRDPPLTAGCLPYSLHQSPKAVFVFFFKVPLEEVGGWSGRMYVKSDPRSSWESGTVVYSRYVETGMRAGLVPACAWRARGARALAGAVLFYAAPHPGGPTSDDTRAKETTSGSPLPPPELWRWPRETLRGRQRDARAARFCTKNGPGGSREIDPLL